MKTRIVFASVLVTMMTLDVSAQRAENDDMYFRGKDRERIKSADAKYTYAPVKTKRQREEAALAEEETDTDTGTNPTDSYSARNVNPEYVSRSNSERASEDETNYYLEGYQPAAASTNFNNSYYNNVNWARNSYYANSLWNSPFNTGMGWGMMYDPWMSPYANAFYDPWMMPSYGFGPSYGWRTGWSMSFMYGNYWSPWGMGMGNPYFGGYPAYYYGGNQYVESPRVNYGRRPSRHSAAVTPTQRIDNRSRNVVSNGNTTTVTSRNRSRQVAQDDYYVRPARRMSQYSGFTPSSTSGNNSRMPSFSNPSSTSTPSRSRNTFSQPSTPSYTPSYTPSRGGSGGSGGGGGGSSPRPRGRG